MLIKYKCELSQFCTEKSAVQKIINSVKKEWEITKIIKKTPGFSSEITYEFEEGEKLCYFVKKDDKLFYCGPINVRRKELRTCTLWLFDYCIYSNDKFFIIKELSYIWDTLYLNSLPENIIYNPCIVANIDGKLQIVKTKEIYDSVTIKDIYIVNMFPSSDELDRTYKLTFFRNDCKIKTVRDIQKFEPSLLFPGKILYQKASSNKYVEYDFVTDREGKEYEYTESYYRRQEENDFWKLIYTENDRRLLQTQRMENDQIQLFDQRIRLQTFGYFEYYFAVNNPIAEIIVDNYFAKNAEVIKLASLFEEDFSHNYIIRIDDTKSEVLYLWLYLCKERMVVEPSVCGVQLCNIIRWYKQGVGKGNAEIEKVISLIDKRISKKPEEVIKLWMKLYPYKSLLSLNGDYMGYRNSAGKKAYLYVCDNLKKLHTKYNAILQELIEQGKISPRWKSEFSLYMLVKSYFPDAIYQYRSEWLQGQSLDIFIPEHGIGIEYQGIQHYKAIDIFGGEKGLEETRKRDKIKREKCKEQKIVLVYWDYTIEIVDENFIDIMRRFNISIPRKQYANYLFGKETIDKTEESSVIYQYNLNGDFIAEYASVLEASEINNIQEYNIRRACTGFRSSAGGYQWRKVEGKRTKDKIPPLQKNVSNGKARKVIQLNLEDKIIKVYNSVSEAVRLTGINSKSIRDAANGKQRHAGGYKWKYEE